MADIDDIIRKLGTLGIPAHEECTGGGCDYLAVRIPDTDRTVWLGWGEIPAPDNTAHGPLAGWLSGCVYIGDPNAADARGGDWVGIAELDEYVVDEADPIVAVLDAIREGSTMPAEWFTIA